MSCCASRRCSSSSHAECGSPCARRPRSSGGKPFTALSKSACASPQASAFASVSLMGYNYALMLYYLLVALYLIVCLLLLLVVLMQQGKGGDMAAAFGGGGSSQAAFGARAGGTVLTRATTI